MQRFFFFLCLNMSIAVCLAIALPTNARLAIAPMMERSRDELSDRALHSVTLPPRLLVQMPQDTGSYLPRAIQRDYPIDRPLPMTGQTTLLDSIDRLNPDRMFDACPDNSQLIEFAESTNFLVQVCLQDTPQTSTVFWMGYAKDGRGSLILEIDRNFEFWNVDTYYAIERRHQGENSYLLIGWPNGNLDAEALLYYYYPCFSDRC